MGLKNKAEDPAYVKKPGTDQTFLYPISNPIKLFLCPLANGTKTLLYGTAEKYNFNFKANLYPYKTHGAAEQTSTK